MALLVATFLLAFALATACAADSVEFAQLSADDECTDDSEQCALSALQRRGSTAIADEDNKGRRCKTWVNCHNGFFGGVKCNGGRHCSVWFMQEEAEEQIGGEWRQG